MVDVAVPLTRASVPEPRVRTSRVVSSEEWGGAAELAAWVHGHGGSALPAQHVGLEISTGAPTTILDTSLTDASYGWWREPTVALALLVTAHREGVVGGYGGSIVVTAGDGTTTFGSWTIRLDLTVPRATRTFELQHFDLPSRGGEIRLVVTAVASVAGLFVDLVQAMEQPRSKLLLDAADYAVLSGSCGAHSPIYDVQYLSARGAVDAYLHTDWRRQGYFHHGSRSNPMQFAGTVLPIELFPFGIPMQAQIRSPGDVTRDDVVVAIEARFNNDGDPGNKAILYVTTDEGGAALSTVVTSAAWATYLFRPDVACEDLDSEDGLSAAAWELLRISAESGGGAGAPLLEIGTIGVYSVNAEGERGFSASDFYTEAAGAALPGTGTMTRSVMFRLDGVPGGSEILFADYAGSDGWALYLYGATVIFEIDDGATFYFIASAALTAGETYVATASWDGADLRLVIDQTIVTAVPVAAALSPASAGASIGAIAGGAIPAPNATILGAAASDVVALSEVQMQNHNALCAAVADMRPFGTCEHLYSARFGLHVDLLGYADLTLTGTTTLERFVPRM